MYQHKISAIASYDILCDFPQLLLQKTAVEAVPHLLDRWLSGLVTSAVYCLESNPELITTISS